MSNIEKEKRELPCPKCKREIEITFGEIFNRREAKCRHCGTLYKFNSANISDLRRSISNLENAQEKFIESFQELVQKADIIIKN